MEWIGVTLLFVIAILMYSINSHLSDIARALGEIGYAISKAKDAGYKSN
jgi:high-affinity Fe2+/Pb2+ permease